MCLSVKEDVLSIQGCFFLYVNERVRQMYKFPTNNYDFLRRFPGHGARNYDTADSRKGHNCYGISSKKAIRYQPMVTGSHYCRVKWRNGESTNLAIL